MFCYKVDLLHNFSQVDEDQCDIGHPSNPKFLHHHQWLWSLFFLHFYK